MSEETWLTAADAGKVLRVTSRQVHRYAEQGHLVTRRAGRRVLFSAASVAKLADDLAVDIRPASQSRELLPPELMQYMQDQANLMQRQGEHQASMDRRLEPMQQQISTQARLLRVVLYLLIAIVVLVAIVLVVILSRG